MRRSLVFLLVVASLGAMAVPASAVLRGENGLILFTSGRNSPDNDDSQAKLFLADVSGIPSIMPTFTPAAGQHRHGTWSPDRTKVAYARGTPGSFLTESFDIYVHDLETGQVTPITDVDTLTADHPAWSPDGTRIAYEEENGNNQGYREVWVEDVENGGRINITQTATTAEHKPAWHPFTDEVYFTVGDPGVNNGLNVAKHDADGGGVTGTVLGDAGVSEFQVSLSPDGSNMCWTEGSGFNGTAEIMVGPTASPQTNKVNLSDDGAAGDYNCTWSPEGDELLYVKGVFTTGRLMRAEWPDTEQEFTVTDDPMNFDGNPDWAPDGRPECPNATATTLTEEPVSVDVQCTDTGPAYEQSDVREFPGNDGPDNGTVTQENIGGPIVYTPDPGFTGPDSFEVGAFDRGGFTDPGTVIVTVEAPPQDGGGGGGGGGNGGGGNGGGTGGGGTGGGGTGGGTTPTTCAGRAFTIRGTENADTLRGTARRDVILALGGNDTIGGLRAGDIVCGGDGNDIIRGNKGGDWLFGDDGDDTLRGGKGRDRLIGGAGIDILRGGKGRDVQLQ